MDYLQGMSDELKTIRLQMVMTPSELAALDEWRREQADLPSRSEAIRRMMAMAIRKPADRKTAAARGGK